MATLTLPHIFCKFSLDFTFLYEIVRGLFINISMVVSCVFFNARKNLVKATRVQFVTKLLYFESFIYGREYSKLNLTQRNRKKESLVDKLLSSMSVYAYSKVMINDCHQRWDDLFFCFASFTLCQIPTVITPSKFWIIPAYITAKIVCLQNNIDASQHLFPEKYMK